VRESLLIDDRTVRAILTFHSIDASGSVISYAPVTFARLLAAVREAGLPVCDLDTLLAPSTRHGITLTFDDGMRSVYTDALPVLREHRVPSHLFLATAAVGGENRWAAQPERIPTFEMLRWHEVEALHAAGVRIESHTHSHPDLRTVEDAAIADECERADALIEQRLGRRPAYFAYPYGRHDARTREQVRSRYRGSVTVELRVLRGSEDRAALPRVDAYYLRSSWTFANFELAPVRAYLAARGLLRRLRGTQ
jgi:peptidoglycan/xylan/chitin deacetylase (PgdA/CDA1 family)